MYMIYSIWQNIYKNQAACISGGVLYTYADSPSTEPPISEKYK